MNPTEKVSISIGSDPSNDIFLNDKAIDPFHAVANLSLSNQIEFIDQNSKYGSYLNGEKISKIYLKQDDSLQLGFSKIAYEELFNAIQLKQKVDNNSVILEKNENDILIEKLNGSTITVVPLSKNSGERDKIPFSSKKRKFEISGKKMEVLLFLLALTIAGISYFTGNLIAKLNYQEKTFIVYQSKEPTIPIIASVFDNTPTFSDCNISNEEKSNIALMIPEAIASPTDSSTGFSFFCDEFDKLKANIDFNQFQRLAKQFLSKNIALAYVKKPNQNQVILLINIGVNNKFSIKHYINKRYHLSAKSSFDAPIHLIVDRQNNSWLPFDLQLDYPGKQYFDFHQKDIIYRFDLDRCGTF